MKQLSTSSGKFFPRRSPLAGEVRSCFLVYLI